MNLVILQNTIYAYRAPFFRGISELPGVNLTVLYCDPSLLDKEFSFNTVYVRSRDFVGITFQPGLLKEIRLQNADVVLVMFNVRYLSMMKLLFKRKLREKTAILLWGHGFGKHGLINSIRVCLAKMADGLLLYYHQQIAEFVELGVDKDKLFSAENTIEVSNYGYADNSKRNTFLFVGRLQERKKIEVVIQGVANVIKNFPEIQLEIVGNGPATPALKRLASQLLPQNNFIFHGKVVDEVSLKAIFDRTIAYVSPGAVGLGVLHAFAYGCPVITAKDDPEHGPEFINLEEGVNALFANADSKSLSSVFRKLLLDPELADDLRRNAAEYYEHNRTMNNMIQHVMIAVEKVAPTSLS